MPHILVISSFVAGSNVGGSLAMKALPRLGCEVSLLPTTMLGRHPGWGAPGGGAVSGDMFHGMAEGLIANGIPAKADAVITGYFASEAQVFEAADIIRRFVKGRAPVIVDPIMGDLGKGLYVREDVAAAIVSDLMPLANLITPNAWEFADLERRRGKAFPECMAEGALDTLMQYVMRSWQFGPSLLITSVVRGSDIGILGAGPSDANYAGFQRVEGKLPNGLGDLVTLLAALNCAQGRLAASLLVNDIVAQLSGLFERYDLPGMAELDVSAFTF